MGTVPSVKRIMCCIVGIGFACSVAHRARPGQSLQVCADRAGSGYHGGLRAVRKQLSPS